MIKIVPSKQATPPKYLSWRPRNQSCYSSAAAATSNMRLTFVCVFVILVVCAAVAPGAAEPRSAEDTKIPLTKSTTLPRELDIPLWRSLDEYLERCARRNKITPAERRDIIGNGMGILHSMLINRESFLRRLQIALGKERAGNFMACDFRKVSSFWNDDIRRYLVKGNSHPPGNVDGEQGALLSTCLK